jgi:hypothetical protein
MTEMTPDFDPRIADWLEDDPELAPTQVRETVFAALPSIPQRRRRWFTVGRRTLAMPSSMRLAATIALIAVVSVGALAYIYRGPSIADRPTPPPTTQPTPTLRVLTEGLLDPGRYLYQGDGVRVIVTVPAGWEGGAFHVAHAPGRELPDGANLSFRQPSTVFSDPCAPESNAQVLGPTVDDLVDALADLPNVTASPPADVTISGFSGTHLEFVVDTQGIECVMGIYGQEPFIRAADHGQHQDLWILDVAGTRLVIDTATYPETSADVRAEVQGMVHTLLIEPH